MGHTSKAKGVINMNGADNLLWKLTTAALKQQTWEICESLSVEIILKYTFKWSKKYYYKHTPVVSSCTESHYMITSSIGDLIIQQPSSSEIFQRNIRNKAVHRASSEDENSSLAALLWASHLSPCAVMCVSLCFCGWWDPLHSACVRLDSLQLENDQLEQDGVHQGTKANIQ